MSVIELRKAVLEFIKAYNRAKGEAPSIRMILKKVKTNRIEFYKAFRSLGEACEAAGVGAPVEREDLMKPALRARLRAQTRPIEKEEPKETMARQLSEYEQDIERSRYAAMLDPWKTSEYISKVLPILDPPLWGEAEVLRQ